MKGLPLLSKTVYKRASVWTSGQSTPVQTFVEYDNGINGVKRFECNHCGKVLSTVKNLKQHKMIHTREKPFKCKFCDTSFNQAARGRDISEQTQKSLIFSPSAT